MTTLAIKDADGVTRYLEMTGTGTAIDPFNPVQEISQSTPDDLNANANMQVNDTDVANGNPVPVSDAGGALTVDQSTHDSFNANANIQVANTDVGSSNPVPVEELARSGGTFKFTSMSSPTSGSAITNAPDGGEYIEIYSIAISSDAAVTVQLKEQTSGTVIGAYYMAANSTIQITPPPNWKLPVADRYLELHSSGAGNIATTVWYESVAS